MSAVLIVGNKNSFLQEIFNSFEAEGLQPAYWEKRSGSFESLDYILYSTVGEVEDVGEHLGELRSLAAGNESRLVLVTPLSQNENENFKKRGSRIDERHVFLTQARPLFTESLWSELKRAIFSPTLKNSYLHINVEADVVDVPKKRRYKLIFISTLFLLFALLPFIEFLIGKTILNNQKAFVASGLAENLLAGASRGFSLYTQLPLVGKSFKGFETNSRQLATLAGVARDFTEIGTGVRLAAMSLFNANDSLKPDEFDDLSRQAKKLEQNLDFLIAEVKEGGGEEIETAEIRSKVKGTLGLLEYLRFVTETKEEKNYLVLVNDSSRLRGSGGVITEFGILKIRSGKIEPFDITLAEDLDLKIKGQVEPPVLFKKYFQDNWHLKDVGWSPDYLSVAARASWFLEKGTGVVVDGVFSLDTKTVKAFKRVLERRDEEAVELFGRELFRGLNEKRILLSTGNPGFADVLNEIGWDGAIEERKCVEVKECTDDYLQIVSSNIVGREAKLEKSYRLEATIEKDKISHKLTASYNNTSEQDVKEYLRIYVQKDAGSFLALVLDSETGKQEQVSLDEALDAGKDVYGFLFNLTRGEKRDIILSWSTKASGESITQYNLVWQKQAGEQGRDVLLGVRYPGKANPKYSVNEGGSVLTRKGSLLYNATLSQDINLRLLWRD